MRSLQHFFKSDTLRRALEVGRERWLALEDLVAFHVGDVEVLVRMDLAYRDHDGRVVIVDWKTGRNEGRFNEVQVAGYALYAAEQGWVEEPEAITTELNYLVIPKAVRRAVDRKRIDNARGFIQKSAGNMKALLVDPLGNLARLEDFPMVDRPSLCRRCNFRRLCFPVKATSDRLRSELDSFQRAERGGERGTRRSGPPTSVAGRREARRARRGAGRGERARPPVATAPRSRSRRRCWDCGRGGGGASS